ncbi:MAG TPA: hypothetical protein VLA96_11440 [Terriglobales bacterium]|nr:hypothetical protein [Terriglobales bacterium]
MASFLRSLVLTVKPEVVAAAGVSAEARRVVEEAQRANGAGKLVALADGQPVRGRIDMLLCAAGHEAKLRAALPQVSEHGVVLLHDREAALALEREGLLSVVLLPTSQPLVLAQRKKPGAPASGRQE